MMSRGILQVNEFVTRIQSLMPPSGNTLDLNLVREIASRFPVPQQPMMINYEEFIKCVGFEFEKYNIVNMIF